LSDGLDSTFAGELTKFPFPCENFGSWLKIEEFLKASWSSIRVPVKTVDGKFKDFRSSSAFEGLERIASRAR
jgi:hypothetical protein